MWYEVILVVFLHPLGLVLLSILLAFATYAGYQHWPWWVPLGLAIWGSFIVPLPTFGFDTTIVEIELLLPIFVGLMVVLCAAYGIARAADPKPT
jgi:hypothetical protein